MADSYDLIIIGAGPGGYVAAIRAAQLGLRTAIVEREHMAGICSNWGCIPTKALLRTAEIYGHMAHAKDYGLTAEKFGVDLKRHHQTLARHRGADEQRRPVPDEEEQGRHHLGRGGADRPRRDQGRATKKPAMQPQVPPPKNALGSGTYRAKNIIVATGARPRVLPGIEPDGDRIWTYFEAMTPKSMPKSLVVMGSGAIGMEFASFLPLARRRGDDHRAAAADPAGRGRRDRRACEEAVRKAGIKFMTEAKVAKVDKTAAGILAHVELKDGSKVDVAGDRLISAVGVQCNSENLGLEKLGVKIDRGAIVVDDHGRTNVSGIWAIGDVAGPPMLAHKAEHEAVIVVETIAGLNVHGLDKLRIPGCTYCEPQVASVGLTEAKARETGRELRIGHFPFIGQRQGDRAGRARGHGENHLRRQDRRAAGGAHGRRRGDRADRGVRRRHEPRNHRGRTHPHHLPASHAQ